MSDRTRATWRVATGWPYGAYGEDKAIMDGREPIARVFHEGSEEKTVSRARLIAKAPASVEELEETLELLDQLATSICVQSDSKAMDLCAEIGRRQESIQTLLNHIRQRGEADG